MSQANGVILVVDDSAESLGMLNTTLVMENYTVLVAMDGVQAISIAEKIQPDLVLMDAIMPNMDGFETCKAFKANTDLMDISRVGLQRARSEMSMRNIRSANLLQVDIDKLVLRRSGNCEQLHEICPNYYQLIAVFRYLRRPLFPIFQEALVSGGRIIYETFNTTYLEQVPDFNPDFLLQIGELEDTFSNWRIIHYDESSHITQLVAVKP